MVARYNSKRGREAKPRPVNLVVKKGSNILAFVSASMPEPVSLTSITTKGPGSSSSYCSVMSFWVSSRTAVRTNTVPPALAGIASAPLIHQIHDDLLHLHPVCFHRGRIFEQIEPHVHGLGIEL